MKKTRSQLQQARRDHCRVRFARIARLREIKAPAWVVKSEQLALALNRQGLKYAGIGRPYSKKQADLWLKHVTPLMGREDDELDS